MRRVRRSVFLDVVGGIVVVLFVVRLCHPDLTQPLGPIKGETPTECTASPSLGGWGTKAHPIRGVHSYAACFPDLQEVQIVSAMRHGVSPVRDRAEAELRKGELLYVGSSPYYQIDPAMNRSIPYLVPRASHLLHHIGRAFLDSLAVKHVPLHTIIVTSVLRTELDVAKLRKHNGNASEQSCHRFGTTFDIAYNRYHTVSPPGEPMRREVRNDTLKYILSEVLRDAREQGLCHVKYEVKQGCFHITVK